MAECVVTFFVENVSALLVGEANLLFGVKEEVRSLRTELEWIRSFLRDADEKRAKNERVRVWVGQIRDVAYDVEDVIDSFILKVELQRRRNMVLRIVGYPNRLLTIHAVATQIHDIKERLKGISVNITRYGLDIQPGESSRGSLNQVLLPKEYRAPIVEETDVVGFQRDVEKLTTLLVGGESRRSVVSIVGMGGLGKTTIARNIYNRFDVRKHFDSCAWVYVSQEYSAKDLLVSIIKQVTKLMEEEEKRELTLMNEEELARTLLNYLKEKSYLIVMDDIWRTEDWDRFRLVFPDEGKGRRNRVLLTTRHKEVALYADPTMEPHELHLLDERESWELFSKKVSCPIDLEELGKKIVAKCGGLPLAIVVLGGLLCRKEKTHGAWSKVVQSASWRLNQDSNRCAEVLALSYADLPYYLKSCFLYFGLFPEDSEIRADRLIRLWIAEGFVKHRGEESMEDVAEDCLDELIHRSMIQVGTRRSDGVVETCRIHDILRDLAISEAKQDQFLDINGNESSVSSSGTASRRLAIHHVSNGVYPTSLLNNPSASTLKLRSLFCFLTQTPEIDLWESFLFGGGIKLLRVLDLEGACIDYLPEEIGELVLLKYLGLRGTMIQLLPPSAFNLPNLQTLDLNSTNISCVPNRIWKLRHLRHLYLLDANVSSSSRPWRIDHLSHLQTLELQAGNWIMSGLDKLTNLRQFSTIGEVSTVYKEALANSLPKLHSLRSLSLEERYKDRPTPTFLPLVSFSQHAHLYKLLLTGPLEKLPSLHDFPPNLTELELTSSRLRQQEDAHQIMATLEQLPRLRVLVLGPGSYEEKEILFTAGRFAKLQYLRISTLDYFEELRVEKGALPYLRTLYLSFCLGLKTLPDGLRHVTTLQNFYFYFPLGFSPDFLSRFEKDTGEEWYKIQHIPNITIG